MAHDYELAEQLIDDTPWLAALPLPSVMRIVDELQPSMDQSVDDWDLRVRAMRERFNKRRARAIRNTLIP